MTPDIIGAVIGTVALILTVIGCTWKLAGRLSSIESTLSYNTVKCEEIHTTVSAHAKECDSDRRVTAVTIRSHDTRITGLEQLPH